MEGNKEKVLEEVTCASDGIEECELDDVVESTDFPFVEGLTDVTFRVQNTKLHINRGIVIIASPVFRKMLTGTSESNESLKEVVLENKEVAAMTLLMKCIYPDQNVTYSGKDTKGGANFLFKGIYRHWTGTGEN